MHNLVFHGLVKRKGIKYHLTKLGSLIFSSILKLEKDIQPDLVEQLSRAILMHSLYEEEGLDIKSYQQVQQLGFLIQEIIHEWIERGEVLEWVDYLTKFDQIIKNLDFISEKYNDQPYIKKILLNTKAKIAKEFSRYHEVTNLLLRQRISLIDRGFYPKRLKNAINLFNHEAWNNLNDLFKNEFSTQPLYELDLDFLNILKKERNNSQIESKISLEDGINTESVEIKEVQNIFELFMPYYKVFAKKFLINQFRNGVLLSDLIKKWNLNWSESANLISILPSAIGKFPIFCFPIMESKLIRDGIIKETILFHNHKGEKSEFRN